MNFLDACRVILQSPVTSIANPLRAKPFTSGLAILFTLLAGIFIIQFVTYPVYEKAFVLPKPMNPFPNQFVFRTNLIDGVAHLAIVVNTLAASVFCGLIVFQYAWRPDSAEKLQDMRLTLLTNRQVVGGALFWPSALAAFLFLLFSAASLFVLRLYISFEKVDYDGYYRWLNYDAYFFNQVSSYLIAILFLPIWAFLSASLIWLLFGKRWLFVLLVFPVYTSLLAISVDYGTAFYHYLGGGIYRSWRPSSGVPFMSTLWGACLLEALRWFSLIALTCWYGRTVYTDSAACYFRKADPETYEQVSWFGEETLWLRGAAYQSWKSFYRSLIHPLPVLPHLLNGITKAGAVSLVIAIPLSLTVEGFGVFSLMVAALTSPFGVALIVVFGMHSFISANGTGPVSRLIHHGSLFKSVRTLASAIALPALGLYLTITLIPLTLELNANAVLLASLYGLLYVIQLLVGCAFVLFGAYVYTALILPEKNRILWVMLSVVIVLFPFIASISYGGSDWYSRYNNQMVFLTDVENRVDVLFGAIVWLIILFGFHPSMQRLYTLKREEAQSPAAPVLSKLAPALQN